VWEECSWESDHEANGNPGRGRRGGGSSLQNATWASASLHSSAMTEASSKQLQSWRPGSSGTAGPPAISTATPATHCAPGQDIAIDMG
jgi:hypothetical protein